MNTSSRQIAAPLSGVVAIVAAALVSQQTARAATCACCVERGTWYEESRRITPEELAEIGRINLGVQATTFGGATLGTTFVLRRLGRPSRQWQLELTDSRGTRTVVAFEIPDKGTFFATDVHNVAPVASGEPKLYKEWRMTGPLSGSGTLKSGQFRLILQGSGAACPNADNFRSWVLQVSGPGVNYSLFGRMASPAARLGA